MNSYLRVVINKKDTKYNLLMEGITPYNIAEGHLEVEFITKSADVTFDLVENVEPVEYVDKYNPTKYGIIFKEKLFVAEECTCSFYLRLADLIGIFFEKNIFIYRRYAGLISLKSC